MNDTSVIAAVSNNGYLTQGGAYFGHSSTPDVPENEGATALVDWERHQVFRDLTRRNDDSPLFPTADLPGNVDSWINWLSQSLTWLYLRFPRRLLEDFDSSFVDFNRPNW